MTEVTEAGEVRLDTTVATKSELLRENYWLREVLQTRLSGMDKALELLQAASDQVPSKTDLAINAANVERDALFAAVTQQFRAIDTATLKQEKVTSDSIEGLQKLFVAQIKGLEDGVKANETRLTRIEVQRDSARTAENNNRERGRDNSGLALGIVVAAATVISVLVSIFVPMLREGGTTSTPQVIQIQPAPAETKPAPSSTTTTTTQ